MQYKTYRNGFKTYLQLERNLSPNTIEAYLHDLELLNSFLEEKDIKKTLKTIDLDDLKSFIGFINEMEFGAYSQARIISGLKAFYKYLLLEKEIENNPTQFLEAPRLGRKLPDILSIEEIENIIKSIDLSTAEGQRNRAIIELLYGSGLRVSELVNLKLSEIDFKNNILIVTGKGNKQRLVPLGEIAKKQIHLYVDNYRNILNIKKGHDDILFLNRRGSKLSRQMIFIMIKKFCEIAGIHKDISPHTFRHSFATHLVQGGADLRVVQQLLGHSSIITTEIYTHLNTDDLRKAILDFHPRNN
ncbi:MAG: site-specific tyrosine recombinase XerD [Marinilabiliales bacterium]|nr:MAG: site-specific tyrosine recombinase XerD [Marinilabiliales bacterium]